MLLEMIVQTNALDLHWSIDFFWHLMLSVVLVMFTLYNFIAVSAVCV